VLMSSTQEFYCKCRGGENKEFQRAILRFSEKRGKDFYACSKGRELGCGYF